jgi:hypothetical protein
MIATLKSIVNSDVLGYATIDGKVWKMLRYVFIKVAQRNFL